MTDHPRRCTVAVPVRVQQQAGKTTFAHRLVSLARLPVVALDERFWRPGLKPLSSDKWAAFSVASPTRLAGSWAVTWGRTTCCLAALNAQTPSSLLGFSLLRCAWQAHRRSSDGWDIWRLVHLLPTTPSTTGCRSGGEVCTLGNLHCRSASAGTGALPPRDRRRQRTAPQLAPENADTRACRSRTGRGGTHRPGLA